MTSSLLQNPKCVGLSIVINVLLIISSAVVISLNWEIIHKTVFSSPHTNSAVPLSGDDAESNTDSVCVSCDYLGEQVRVNDTEYADIVKTNCGNKLCCLNDREIQHFLKAVGNITTLYIYLFSMNMFLAFAYVILLIIACFDFVDCEWRR